MKKRTPWYKMDNASVMYSSLQKEEFSAIYRFSAVMQEQVNPEALQRAIDKVLPRFPGFRSKIRKGFFWHYFEPNRAPGPFLKKDVAEPCRPVRFQEDNHWLVRFFYYEKRISVEVFHAISDGAGTLVFFRVLLAQYLRELGVDVPVGNGIFDLEEKSTPEEWEDAYSRYALKKGKIQPMARHVYQNEGTSEPFYTFNVTMGFMPVDKVKERAKFYGVTVNDYLGAAFMYVLMEKQRRENPVKEKKIALSVPVNLRSYFPTKTLRNFILTLQPWFDPSLGDYTFQEIANRFHHYMRIHCTRQEMQAAFSQNVKFQTNRLLKLAPIFIKMPVMSLSYRLRGTDPYSAIMTNPGLFKVPEEMAPHIHHMEVVAGQAFIPRAHMASISYGNILEVTFSGTMKESDTERDFFRFLVKEGIPVKVESNRQYRKNPEGGR